MADLSAASLEDVKDFFRQYYAPNNAVIAVAGAVKRDSVLQLVRKYFGSIPRGPAIERPAPLQPQLTADTMVVLEDRVQLPRLYYNFETVRAGADDDAALQVAAYVLSGAKNSRLTQRLVYTDQIASNVFAGPDHRKLAGEFGITVTARPGHSLPEMQRPSTRSCAPSPRRDRPSAKSSRPATALRPPSFGTSRPCRERPINSTSISTRPENPTASRQNSTACSR